MRISSGAFQRIVAAIAYCHLGSSVEPHPGAESGFVEAKQLGLLAQDSVWRATERGIGVLIASGRMDGEPAPERVALHVLWAAGPPFPVHFVAAFPDGMVDCFPNLYARQRADAERAHRDLAARSGVTDVEFFTTLEHLDRPKPEEGERR